MRVRQTGHELRREWMANERKRPTDERAQEADRTEQRGADTQNVEIEKVINLKEELQSRHLIH